MLKIENKRLRDRVAELERELAAARAAAGGKPDQRITQLIRKKDLELEESHEELRARAREAQKSADELATKNEELVNSMAALRLYQLMFENDPNGLLGVSPEGQIVQFNSSAIRFFGYELHQMRMRDVDGVEIKGSGADLRALFNEAMDKGESTPVECALGDRKIRITCYRLEDIRGQRGVVFRVAEREGA